MADFKAAKVVAAVPTPPEPDTIYLVRRGEGFDLWATNGVGTIVAYPLNADELPTLTIDDITGLDTALAGKASTTDPRLSDAREWSEATVSQSEAETGTATTPRKWTAQRVRQGIIAWFNGISGALGRTILTRTTAAQVRSDIGLGTAATATLTTSNTDDTAGRVLKVGDGGWMGQGVTIDTSLGYPSSISDVTNQTKVFRSAVLDEGIRAYTAGFHFSTADSWGRLRVDHLYPQAWIQGGYVYDGVGWTSQVVLSANMLQTTGNSTEFPMSQKAVTDALATKAALNATATQQGGLKARLDGTTLYLTNNGTNP